MQVIILVYLTSLYTTCHSVMSTGWVAVWCRWCLQREHSNVTIIVTRNWSILHSFRVDTSDGAVQDAGSVTVQAIMQPRKLELIHFAGGSTVKYISFGAVYYGMEVCQPTLLFNNCPEPTSFVIVLDEQAAGTETVCAILYIHYYTLEPSSVQNGHMFIPLLPNSK